MTETAKLRDKKIAVQWSQTAIGSCVCMDGKGVGEGREFVWVGRWGMVGGGGGGGGAAYGHARQSHLLVGTLQLSLQSTGWEDAEVLVAVVATVGAVVTHQCIWHTLHAIRAREGGRKWR